MAKKKKKTQAPVVKLSPKNYIRSKARSLPFGPCYVNDNWTEMGLAVVWVTRQQPSGKYIVGWYLVDIYCLGVKNADFYFGVTADEFKDISNQYENRSNLTFAPVTSTIAQNIIYGALEYAEDLGFSPHKDFETPEYILDPADRIEFVEIEFGKNGKPFYSSGPSDNTQKIVRQLEQKVGVGNFDFLIQSPESGAPDFNNKYDDDYYYDEDDYYEEGEEDISENAEDMHNNENIEIVEYSIDETNPNDKD